MAWPLPRRSEAAARIGAPWELTLVIKRRRWTTMFEPVTERPPRVLVLMGNHAELDMLGRQIPGEQFEVLGFTSASDATEAVHNLEIDVVVADEDLEDRSGLDWLLEVRSIDPATSLVLLAAQAHGLDLAVDAVNRADICKLLTKPWDADELLDELEDAASRYVSDTRRDRKLVLSQLRVDRLSRDFEQALRERNQFSRIAGQSAMFTVSAPSGGDQAGGDTLAPETAADLADLMATIAAAATPGGAAVRVRMLMEGCVERLAWPAEEAHLAVLAASLHHALLPMFPKERQIETRGGGTQHATVLGRRLSRVPGFGSVASIIAVHHTAYAGEDGRSEAPRAAKLLQILSLYDELMHDEDTLASPGAQQDPDFALTRASETMLALAGRKLDPVLCQRCVKEFVPAILGRKEHAVPVGAAEEGMVLSRTVYAENLPLVRAGTTLNKRSLEKVQSASEIIGFTDVWVHGVLDANPATLPGVEVA